MIDTQPWSFAERNSELLAVGAIGNPREPVSALLKKYNMSRAQVICRLAEIYRATRKG